MKKKQDRLREGRIGREMGKGRQRERERGRGKEGRRGEGERDE